MKISANNRRAVVATFTLSALVKIKIVSTCLNYIIDQLHGFLGQLRLVCNTPSCETFAHLIS